MLKIAFIGAGSLGFCRQLLTDILSVPELRNSEIAFTDINAHNLAMVTQLCQRDLEDNGLSTKILSTTNRKEAFKDAKYVINCIRQGVLEGFETDVEIPLKYGVDQCVGDTLCIGGILYGQRTVIELLDICKDIREVALPSCMLLNYSNPNAMVTWACNQYGKVPTIGLCHGEMHGEEQIAKAFGLERKDLDVICAGINHQTWYISVKHKGEELTGKLYEAFLKMPEMVAQEKVRLDILKRFGYYSTESNGHLSEYVSWYRKRPSRVSQWIDPSSWIHGETAGYLRVCREGRNWFEFDFPQLLEEPPKKYDGTQRGNEHGSYIIESLETGRVYRGHFNMMNHGCITNLSDECVVEVPCYVDGNGISMPRVGDLPIGCAAICSQSIWVQKLSVEAAVSGNVTLLKQAAMMDPLTGAVCYPDEISQMVDEMLIAQEEWLPQYAEAITAAKEYFSQGNLLSTDDSNRGAVRIHEKTVAEMAENAKLSRAIANAAAKETVQG